MGTIKKQMDLEFFQNTLSAFVMLVWDNEDYFKDLEAKCSALQMKNDEIKTKCNFMNRKVFSSTEKLTAQQNKYSALNNKLEKLKKKSMNDKTTLENKIINYTHQCKHHFFF